MPSLETLRAALSPLELPDAEWSEFQEALDRPARGGVRIRDPHGAGDLPFTTRPVDWHRRGRFVEPPTRPAAYVEYAAGDYYVQDPGSLLPLTLLEPHWESGVMVCDLCAAPGGKSTAILESLNDSGWLLANEVVASRRGALSLNLARHGSARYLVSGMDPDQLADQLGACFDIVLVDAPCSGQSLIGRRKQTESAFSERAVRHCAARQTRILAAAARLVRDGGTLVYSTCTFAPAENEQQVQRLLDSSAERPGTWQLEPDSRLAAWDSPLLPGTYRLWPHRDECGGGFAARLTLGASNANRPRRPGKVKSPLSAAPLPPGFEMWGELTANLVAGPEDRRFAWPEGPPRELLRVAAGGPEVAFLKNRTWFPSFALALRRAADWSPATTRGLSDEEARRYVAGEALAGHDRGWSVATWRGRPLGWLKDDGRHAKNHLPKPARLRIT